MSTKLLPCPFCGGAPKWVHHSDFINGGRLMSLGCCEFRKAGRSAELIAAWNRRTAIAATKGAAKP